MQVLRKKKKTLYGVWVNIRRITYRTNFELLDPIFRRKDIFVI